MIFLVNAVKLFDKVKTQILKSNNYIIILI